MHSGKYPLIGSCAVLSLTVFLLITAKGREQGLALAERIAPRILRFHVLANSNLPNDQSLKLEIRDLLLTELAAEGNGPSATKREICETVLARRSELEEKAERLAASRGFDYNINICLEQCEFPDRAYGDLFFPAGTYDAVRVRIGAGAGNNYWCVLYPSLCYLDGTHAAVADDSKERLKAVIPEDDFLALLSARRLSAGTENLPPAAFPHTDQKAADGSGSAETSPRLAIRFKLSDWLRELTD